MTQIRYKCPFCGQVKHRTRRVNRDLNIQIIKANRDKGSGQWRGRLFFPSCAIGKRIKIEVLED